MVDFNSEGAFSANKSHILELVILGRRDELINTFQMWRESLLANTSKEQTLKHKLRSVLFALFLELERPLYRKLTVCNKKTGRVEDSSKYDALRDLIMREESITNDDLMVVYFQINDILDSMNLIKIDNKKVYDTTSVEAENNEKGM